MSTVDAKRVTNTNIDLFIKDVDNTIQIDKILNTKEEILENGCKVIWSLVRFKPFINNAGVLKQPKDNWCVLLEEVSAKIRKKVTLGDNTADLIKLGLTLNQQLYIFTYLIRAKDKSNYNINDYIFIRPAYYKRKQNTEEPNYDKYSVVGNKIEADDCLFNLKRVETFNLYSLHLYDVTYPLYKNSNITITRVNCGSKCGPVGYERTKYLNMFNIEHCNKGLFEIPDELYDKKRKSYEVYRISGNKKNHSIANLDLRPYGNVTSKTRSKEGFMFYYINNSTGDISEDFNDITEMVDDLILRDVFDGAYSPLELDNLVCSKLRDGGTIDDFIQVYKYQNEDKTLNNENKYTGAKIWFIENPYTGKLFGSTDRDTAQKYLAGLMNIEPTSAGRYLRNVGHSKELATELKQKGQIKANVWLKDKDITFDDIRLYGTEEQIRNLPRLF